MKQHLHYHRQVLRRRHSGGLKLLECNSNITNITRITHHPYLSLNMICSSHKKKTYDTILKRKKEINKFTYIKCTYN